MSREIAIVVRKQQRIEIEFHHFLLGTVHVGVRVVLDLD